ncbi:hypothetical protein MishRS11D_10280 [Methylomagnum ishizawai]|nr:hypothetical protein MishRS11D_10280 [Methylomagnum ishizawai]
MASVAWTHKICRSNRRMWDRIRVLTGRRKLDMARPGRKGEAERGAALPGGAMYPQRGVPRVGRSGPVDARVPRAGFAALG